MGDICYEADRLLKSVVHGEDNVTGDDMHTVLSSVADYEYICGFWEDYYDGSLPTGQVLIYLETGDVELTLDSSRDAFVFSKATMHCDYEDVDAPGTVWTTYEEYSAMIQDNYDDFAAEIPEWEDLRTAAKHIAVAYFLYDEGLTSQIDWDYVTEYELDWVDADWWTPAVSVTCPTFTYDGSDVTIAIEGGAELTTHSQTYASDTSGDVQALWDAILDDRGADTDFSWSYTAPDTSTGTAVAVPAAPVPMPGDLYLSELDLVVRTPGQLQLTANRWYSSVTAMDGVDRGMGPGWDFVPARAQASTFLVDFGSTWDAPSHVDIVDHVLDRTLHFEF